MERLGELLKRRRLQLGLSLRDIEDKTQISNAYISQLETEKISQPSPSILRKLSEFYDISYTRLMVLAGHPIAPKDDKKIFLRTSNALEEITKEEERELLRYLQFLRMERERK